jgi:hypothetical protein
LNKMVTCHLLTRRSIDWSHEQLLKHSAEIQSYLGNFYLRITSNKMAGLVTSANPRSRQDIFESCLLDNSVLQPFKNVIDQQGSLAPDVQQCLDRLQVADALHLIVELLRMVRPPQQYFILPLTEVSPIGKLGFDISIPVVQGRSHCSSFVFYFL